MSSRVQHEIERIRLAWRRAGFGGRIVKTAVGAAIAWELGKLVPENRQPYLAPMTVILVTQATIAGSLAFAAQRGLGVLAGVAIAVGATATIGLHSWSIALVVGLSLLTGVRLRLSAVGVQQVAVSALLVLLLGPKSGTDVYALHRIADTIIGMAVGLSFNALLPPSSHVPRAETAVRDLGERVAGVLDGLAADLAAGITPRQAARRLAEARAVATALKATKGALDRAEESLKYNLFGGGGRGRLSEAARAAQALDHGAIQVRVMARVVQTLSNDVDGSPLLQLEALGSPLSELFAANAAVVRAFLAPDRGERFGAALRAGDEGRAAAERAARTALAAPDSGAWVMIGELLAVSDRLTGDLRAASGEA